MRLLSLSDPLLNVFRRLRGLCFVSAVDFQGGGITSGKKPFPAAHSVAPTLQVNAFGVVAQEKIGFEIVIFRTRPMALQMRRAPSGQLGFLGGDAAIGAGQEKHDEAPDILVRRGGLSAPRTPREYFCQSESIGKLTEVFVLKEVIEWKVNQQVCGL